MLITFQLYVSKQNSFFFYYKNFKKRILPIFSRSHMFTTNWQRLRQHKKWPMLEEKSIVVLFCSSRATELLLFVETLTSNTPVPVSWIYRNR